MRGELVRRMRMSKAWSQSDLAKRAGLRQATVSNVERRGIARYSTALAIAGALGVSVTEITFIMTEGVTQWIQ